MMNGVNVQTPAFGLYSYNPALGAAESSRASTNVSPQAQPVTPLIWPDLTVGNAWSFTDIMTQNINNSLCFRDAFPGVGRPPGGVFISETQANRQSRLIFRAYRLKEMEHASAELYRSWDDGGIFAEGNFEDAMRVLRAKGGRFDDQAQKLVDLAEALSPAVLRHALVGHDKEVNMKDRASGFANDLAAEAFGADILDKFEIEFGVGGIVPLWDAVLARVLRDSGLFGSGDLGFFSGIDSKLEVGIETKLQGLSGGLFDTQIARNLFLEGMSYMAGQDLDIMVLLTPDSFAVLWRTDLPDRDPATGAPVSQFSMWPYFRFAPISDDTNELKLRRILAQCARISAFPRFELRDPDCSLRTDRVRIARTATGTQRFVAYSLQEHLTQEELDELRREEVRLSQEEEADF